MDEDFEKSVHDLTSYFRFFNLDYVCESILRFYSPWMNETDISCEMIPIFRVSQTVWPKTGTGYRRVMDPFRQWSLHQEFCVSKLHKHSQECVEVWTHHWWICPFSVGTKVYEHMYTVHEYENHFTSPGSILLGLTPSCRYSNCKFYSQDSYSRGSFHLWVKDDYKLVVTVLQKPHSFGCFGLTPKSPNVIS